MSKKNQIHFLLTAAIIFPAGIIQAQEKTSGTLNLSFEFRPRAEFRYGYRQLPADTSQPAYFVSQRSRLNLTYKRKNFILHTSLQDIRVWGEYGQNSGTGTDAWNVFEAYVEPSLDSNWSLRIGRQQVELDNGRLFAAANWSQESRAHDGINFIYKSRKIHSQLLGFFNQTSERIFETDYSPSFSNYKALCVHYIIFRITDAVVLKLLNSADAYPSPKNQHILYVRGTSGGRVEFTRKKIYLTASGYYQFGNLASGQQIAGYYFQPEIKYTFSKKLNLRLGMEYLSGDDANRQDATSHSFVPLYGVAHRFMGTMDYFTSFPKDVKNGGLADPYLFISYRINEKITLSAQNHLFYLQNHVMNKNIEIIDKYLGFESDLLLRYRINNYTSFEAGFSGLLAEKSLETLKGGNSSIIPVWSYLMISFKPDLFTTSPE